MWSGIGLEGANPRVYAMGSGIGLEGANPGVYAMGSGTVLEGSNTTTDGHNLTVYARRSDIKLECSAYVSCGLAEAWRAVTQQNIYVA